MLRISEEDILKCLFNIFSSLICAAFFYRKSLVKVLIYKIRTLIITYSNRTLWSILKVN